MSDLRFFADHMHAAIEADRARLRLREYARRAAAVRAEVLATFRGERLPVGYHKAEEALCAARILLGEKVRQ